MEPKILAHVFLKETVSAVTMFYKDTKAMVPAANGDTDIFDIVAGILRRDT